MSEQEDAAIERHLRQAEDAEARDDFVEALRAYRAALATNLDCLPALLGVARLSLALGYLDRAVEDFTRALMLDRECAEARLGRGQALLELDLVDRAKIDLAAAAELAPDDPDVALACGELLLEVGESEAACATLRAAQRLAGGQDPDVALALAWALLHLDAPDVDELRTNHQLAAASFGAEDPAVQIAHAGLHHLQGHTARARQLLAAALEQEPELAERLPRRLLPDA